MHVVCSSFKEEPPIPPHTLRHQHTYIANPVNGQILLTWNKSPRALRGTDESRLLADVLLEELSVSVSERLYHSFFNLVDELQLGKGGQSPWPGGGQRLL